MGTYHQGGVIPTQLWLGTQDNVRTVFWWRTYSPPIWMLDGNGVVVETVDLMGLKAEEMMVQVRNAAVCDAILSQRGTGIGNGDGNGTAIEETTYLVAPHSSTFLDRYTVKAEEGMDVKVDVDLHLEQVWSYAQHINLDDLDFADEGVWLTLKRAVGRRGLGVWKVTRRCS